MYTHQKNPHEKHASTLSVVKKAGPRHAQLSRVEPIQTSHQVPYLGSVEHYSPQPTQMHDMVIVPKTRDGDRHAPESELARVDIAQGVCGLLVRTRSLRRPTVLEASISRGEASAVVSSVIMAKRIRSLFDRLVFYLLYALVQLGSVGDGREQRKED